MAAMQPMQSAGRQRVFSVPTNSEQSWLACELKSQDIAFRLTVHDSGGTLNMMHVYTS